MLLVIDIGNTNLTLGIYTDKQFGPHWRLATDHQRMADEYGLQLLGLLEHVGLNLEDIDGICLSSVVPTLTGRLMQACRVYLLQEPLLVDAELNTGVTIKYDNPSAVGTDRIADAAAVVQLFGAPACVVDFGTATTFNAINRNNEYLGGAITAGVNVAMEALVEHTSKLQKVDLQKPPSIIGSNTVHAMQSGMMYGYISLVEGMVKRFKQELGEDTKVVATGGLSEIIASETDVFDVVAPWLTLDGLRIIWEKNH